MLSSLTHEQKQALNQKIKAQKEAGKKTDVCDSRVSSSASLVSPFRFSYPEDSRAAVSLGQKLYENLGPNGAKLGDMYSSAAETSVSQAQRPQTMDDIFQAMTVFQKSCASNLAAVTNHKNRSASKETAKDCLDDCKSPAENVSDTLACLTAKIREMEARNQELEAENKELKQASVAKDEAIGSYRVALEETRGKFHEIVENVMKSWDAVRQDDSDDSRLDFVNSVPTLLGVEIPRSSVTGTTTAKTNAGDVKQLEGAVSALRIDNDGAASVASPVSLVATGSGGGGGSGALVSSAGGQVAAASAAGGGVAATGATGS
jgi:hypothetical protein